MTLGSLWVVQTHNNIGSLDENDDVFCRKHEADEEADARIKCSYQGRRDWVVVPLMKAIEERVSDECYNALICD